MNQISRAPLYPFNFKSPFKNIVSSIWFLALAVVLLLGVTLSVVLPHFIQRTAPESAPMPLSSAIEQRWGIRITMVAATADGGMVDLRYQVLDPDKAQSVGVDATSTPKLISHDQSVVAETAPMPHKEILHAGETYFLLYHNAMGAIKAQRYITISLGDLHLENVPVR